MKHVKRTWGKFGFKRRTGRGVTFGMNEKGGMDSVELAKYLDASILPLYPDVEDVPGKRLPCH
jgi:hypothetical protein